MTAPTGLDTSPAATGGLGAVVETGAVAAP